MKRTKEIEKVNEEIIDRALVFASFAGVLVYSLSISKLFTTGFEISFITDFIAVGAIVLTTVFRTRLSLKFKAYIILLGIFAVVLIDVYEIGILSANKVLLIVLPFFALFAFSWRRTIVFTIIILLAIAVLAYLHLNGHIERIANDNIHALGWVINIAMIILVSFILLVTFIKYNNAHELMISRLSEANRQLTVSEQNYKEIFNSSSDGILIFNLGGQLESVNSTLENLKSSAGYQETSVQDWLTGFDKQHDKQAFSQLLNRAQKEETLRVDWIVPEKGQQDYRWVELDLKMALIAGNPKILCLLRDIQEKKSTRLELEKYKQHLEDMVEIRTRDLKAAYESISSQKKELEDVVEKLNSTQERLMQSDKMASLGLLASGIAHEINNPLNFIKGGISAIALFMQDHLDSNVKKELQPFIEGSLEGVQRAARIVSGLTIYGNAKENVQTKCNLSEIIKNCMAILRNEYLNNISIAFDCDGTEVVTGNPAKLHQVFLNILTNAIHAIEGSGQINISIGKQNLGFFIKIKDSGIGISQDAIGRVSDPFYTTKDPGEGTGLGLYIVYNIIQEHNGTVELESETGKGTTVSIYLPS
jgi:PAS domain S-box-containing protein